MAVPKKKVSRGRRNMRRFSPENRPHAVTVSTCPECREPVRPHRVCKCGFYANKQILKFE